MLKYQIHLLFKVSLVLYCVQNSPDPDGSMRMDNPLVVPQNCAVMIPLKQVEPEMIKYVKNLKNSDDYMDFANKYGHSDTVKVSDILWLCTSLFSSSGKQILVPQILWFTEQDAPHQSTSNEAQQAFQKAKDLQQLQVDFTFFPMKQSFDGDLFYKELITLMLDVDPDDFEFPKAQLDEKILLQRVFRRACTKRALNYLTVELSEKAKFGVGVYSFARKSSLPKSILLSRDTKEHIVPKREYKVGTVPEDMEIEELVNIEANLEFKDKLEASSCIKYQQCGGEKIRFTPMEAYEIKQVMDPKIKILGFKPRIVVNIRNHIKSPYFIYPDDKIVKNSSLLFRTLWEVCLAEDEVVICIAVMRLKSLPKLVALVPQKQSDNDEGEGQYDGFRMEFLPYAGDIRDLSEHYPRPEVVDPSVTDNMKKICGRLRLNYSASMFDNPAVTKIFSKIEEQVYDEVDDEMYRDNVMPNAENQDGRIGEVRTLRP